MPRHGVVTLTEAEKASEGDDRVNDLAAYTMDHQVINGANLLTVAAKHGSGRKIFAREKDIAGL